MYLLITYDVSTIDADGRRRLRRVAKACLDYGQRVQNSVFECKVDAGQFATLKAILLEIIQPDSDSIRFYNLGNNWEPRVEQFGKNDDYNIEKPLIV